MRAGHHHVEIEATNLSRHNQDVVVPERGQFVVEMEYDPMPD